MSRITLELSATQFVHAGRILIDEARVMPISDSRYDYIESALRVVDAIMSPDVDIDEMEATVDDVASMHPNALSPEIRAVLNV